MTTLLALLGNTYTEEINFIVLERQEMGMEGKITGSEVK